jgi:pimeloyl-ACP methyl ester carboxylesterase
MSEPTQPAGSAGSASKTKAMVFVHGAGDWPEAYWTEITNRPEFDGLVFTPIGVRYCQIFQSDLANQARTSPDATRFQNDFISLIAWERLSLEMSARGSTMPSNLAALLNPVNFNNAGIDPQKAFLGFFSQMLFGIDFVKLVDLITQTQLPNGIQIPAVASDVFLYLYNPSIARQIRDQLAAGLAQAKEFDEIILVSHSLGTVVAFDVLLQNPEFIPKISYWFTLGCPIHKVMRLRPLALPSPLPHAQIRNWFNIYDSADIVAGALGPSVDISGCFVHDIFVKIANGMPQAHDYFGNAASRSLIARAAA